MTNEDLHNWLTNIVFKENLGWQIAGPEFIKSIKSDMMMRLGKHEIENFNIRYKDPEYKRQNAHCANWVKEEMKKDLEWIKINNFLNDDG